MATAVDAASAIEALTAHRHHLLVLHLDTSDDGGTALLKALNDNSSLRSVPVLAYHGQPLTPGQETLLQALANHRPLEILPSLDDLRERITLHLTAGAPERVVPLSAPAAAIPGAVFAGSA